MSVLNNKQKGVAASTHLLCGMQPLHLYHCICRRQNKVFYYRLNYLTITLRVVPSDILRMLTPFTGAEI